MKKVLLWLLAFIITILAAYYQRKTGPTYPKRAEIPINDTTIETGFVRSLGLDERSAVKMAVTDTTIRARLFYKRFRSTEEYRVTDFTYRVYPVNSPLMNKVFKITEEKGYFADIPPQPPAGKLQYYIEITDSKGTFNLFREEPIVIRYKGAVPGYILTPHILFMFFAMFFSTLAGLMSLTGVAAYKRYSAWTLALLLLGGMILGPLVQKFAFGDLWTGVPFGWDLTDNKTLIAFIFWIIAVVMNRKKERPAYTALASVVLLLVYSIPHSLFGSELDYATGEVTQGFAALLISVKFFKKS